SPRISEAIQDPLLPGHFPAKEAITCPGVNLKNAPDKFRNTEESQNEFDYSGSFIRRDALRSRSGIRCVRATRPTDDWNLGLRHAEFAAKQRWYFRGDVWSPHHRRSRRLAQAQRCLPARSGRGAGAGCLPEGFPF